MSAQEAAQALVQPFTRPRCAEAVRSTCGYSRCHLTEHGPGQSHHVTGVQWTGRLGDGSMRLTFRDGCTPACLPEEVLPWGGWAFEVTESARARARHPKPGPEFERRARKGSDPK